MINYMDRNLVYLMHR